MLAVFSLVGLAISGLGFIDFSGSDDDDANDQSTPDAPQTEATEQSGDFFKSAEVSSQPTSAAPEPEAAPSPPPLKTLTEGRDIFFGGNEAVNVDGGAGNDYIDGEHGDDIIRGGDGDDELRGSYGNDKIWGDAGDDEIYGGPGNDHLYGGDGNDKLVGGAGNDHIDGGAGDDSIMGMWGNNTLIGGAGKDTIMAGRGDDVINGVEEGEQESDYLNGGGGNDTITAGAGDIASGGEGNDTFILHPKGGVITIMDYDPADDTVELTYTGEPPVLSAVKTEAGVSLMADGEVVVKFNGAKTIDTSAIKLVPTK